MPLDPAHCVTRRAGATGSGENFFGGLRYLFRLQGKNCSGWSLFGACRMSAAGAGTLPSTTKPVDLRFQHFEIRLIS